MMKHGWASSKFLIDGFPRNYENFIGWNEKMLDHADMKFVLFLDCSEDNMIERIKKRAEASGENKRNDDNIETLKKRFGVFKEQSMPVIDLYKRQNKVKTINAN